ncbi:predicted protein [Cyanophage PSS2]|uniref:hypothetical protein n=1 Tax=Cyanophage PSS2 TaxID=658401 RepID=UPI0001B04054|nr:hypothetical protein PSS2_gp127 [Cyanophage PSS2]ACT65689.1 hypothetical protein [Cyanophage PSS2]ACY75825.1 predicted protein [Cyanophage PSS2]
MTTITKDSESLYTLNVDGIQVGVAFSDLSSKVTIMTRPSGKGMFTGRSFHGSSRQEQLVEACEGYDDRSVKRALRALVSSLLP